MPSGKKIRKSTITNYETTFILLSRFEKQFGETLKIQFVHRASLRQSDQVRHYWQQIYKKFLGFLYQQRNVYDNYAGSVLKVLKTFLRYLSLYRNLPTGDFYKTIHVPRESFIPAILSPEQLRYLIADEGFAGSLSPILRRTKDIFVFGCTAGLRYQDLMKLKQSNLQCNGTAVSLLLHTQKTGTALSIPLPGYAIEILNRLKKGEGRYLLPRAAGSNFNIQVKKLIRAAGWDYYWPKYRQRRGEQIEIRTREGEPYRFYDHITAHTMRRTAITTLLLLGVDENTVRRISGHAPGSKEFYRYVVISQDFLTKKILDAHARLLSPDWDPAICGLKDKTV